MKQNEDYFKALAAAVNKLVEEIFFEFSQAKSADHFHALESSEFKADSEIKEITRYLELMGRLASQDKVHTEGV